MNVTERMKNNQRQYRTTSHELSTQEAHQKRLNNFFTNLSSILHHYRVTQLATQTLEVTSL